MLTLKRPITLTTQLNMLSVSNSLGERIRSGYALLSAAFTAKELLHLLVSPPEAPVAGDSITHIALSSQVENRQNILLDVVNNIINRILLADQSQLTYQDRIYVDMALRKFGIENTSLFLKEAEKIRSESLLLHAQYNHATHHREAVPALLSHYLPSETPSSAQPTPTAPKEGPQSPAFSLHESIFTRLKSAEIYETMRKFTASHTESHTILSRQELLICEQSKTSERLKIEAYNLKTESFKEPHLTYLESNTRLSTQPSSFLSEAGLVAQAASSVLLQTFENVLFARISHYAKNENLWVDIRNSVAYTAKNALSRLLMQLDAKQYNTATSNLDITRTSNASFYNEAPLSLTNHSDETLLKELLPESDADFSHPERQKETTHFIEGSPVKTDLPSPERELPPRPSETQPAAETVLHTERESHSELTQTELLTALTEIDRQNRERVEKIIKDGQNLPAAKKPAAPGRKRTMKDALRALESPEQVIAEAVMLSEAREKPETEYAHILAHADSSTLHLIEQLRLLNHDPQAAEQMGIRRVSDPAELNSEVTRIERERTEMIQRVHETEAAELNRLAAMPSDRAASAGSSKDRHPPLDGGERLHASLPFVHRQTATQSTDELTQNLKVQQQTTSETQKSETHVINEQSHITETQVQDITKVLLNRTAEDVTELINKTLMRQIGTISDKVYGQLEKKLQNERSRRGRF